MDTFAEFVIYPFLFFALYFEVFLLLTFLSKSQRGKQSESTHFSKVAIIVPCYNEEETITETLASLKTLEYPKEMLQIIVVNDGSTDRTKEELEVCAKDVTMLVLHTENKGKHAALNLGMEYAKDAEFVACLDADSFVGKNALKEIIPYFENEKVGAVTASMSVHESKNPLQSMQYADYLFGIAYRHILSKVNGLYVTPGAFSVYRKRVFTEIGTFRKAHQTEDMEIALRMQKMGWIIENAPRALVFTKVPKTLWGLLKQRTRWTSGFLRNGFEYRSLFGNFRHGVLGLLVLPLGAGAVVGGIVLFIYTIVEAVRQISDFFATQGDVPWSFLFQAPSFDWFFAPASGILVLALVILFMSGTLIVIGKRIAKVPGSLAPGMLWYALLYNLVAPLWLIRSAVDVLFGIERTWR